MVWGGGGGGWVGGGGGVFFFSSRRRHTRSLCDWSSDVCSSDLISVRTLMHEAVSMGDIEQVKSLIERGADINAKDEQGEIPFYRNWRLLHRTVHGSNRIRMAKFLLRSEERRVGKECR